MTAAEQARAWPLDDQPVALSAAPGPVVAVTCPVGINDVVISAVQGHASDEILRRGVDPFNRPYADGAAHPRVMSFSLHSYLFRLRPAILRIIRC